MIILIIAIALMIWGIIELLFYITHRRPLSEIEIKKLSLKRTKKYIRRNYHFEKYNIAVDKRFKSSMNKLGKLYSIRESLHAFLSLAAALLKSKKHEWVLLAIEKENIVTYLWMNKGDDNKSVAFSCSLNEIISLCKLENAYSIMRFHNHPNGSLSASNQDYTSAKTCSERVNSCGLNWLDFICVAGNFVLYSKDISNTFCPSVASIEVISKENGISPKIDYKLQRELGFFR